MAQPYLPRSEQGEASHIFIGGQPSHAVLKHPAAGDFRVQSTDGGSVAPVELPARIVRQCAGIVEMAGPL
jgi:glutathione synthase/RimK-type ligase-like ATP-grasp enzyme